MPATVDPPRPPPQASNRIEKLLRRALDPAALDGEAETSGVMFIRTARREGLSFEDLFVRALPAPETEPPSCWIVMPCGKHRGRELGEIARKDLSYLRRLATEFERDDIREAASVVLAYFTRGVSR